METQTVRRAVTPRPDVARPFRERPERLLPLEPIGDLVPLEEVASREAQELRLHVDHHLHDVGPEAVRLILEGWREQRDQAEPDRAGPIHGEHVPRRGRWRDAAGLKRHFVLLPRPAHARDGSRGVDRLPVVALNRDGNRAAESGSRLRVERGAGSACSASRECPSSRRSPLPPRALSMPA